MSMRSEIKKLLVVALCASLFTCFAVGCGGSKDNKDSSKASTTSSAVSKTESKAEESSKTESKTESKAEESSKTESKAEESSKTEESKAEESSKTEESKAEESSKTEESQGETPAPEQLTIANLVGLTEDKIDEAFAGQTEDQQLELVYVSFKDNTALVMIGDPSAEQPSNVIYGAHTVENVVQTEAGVSGEVTITDAAGKAYKANVSNTADGAFSFTLAEDNIAFSGVKVDNANALKAVTTAVESLYAANNPAEEPVEENPDAEGEEENAEGEGEEAVEE